jgi:hypothetical protein
MTKGEKCVVGMAAGIAMLCVLIGGCQAHSEIQPAHTELSRTTDNVRKNTVSVRKAWIITVGPTGGVEETEYVCPPFQRVEDLGKEANR